MVNKPVKTPQGKPKYDYPKEPQTYEIKPKPKKRRPLGPYLRTAGRIAGRAARGIGRGVYQTGAGFVEGIGPLPRPSFRAAGRLVGQATKEGVKAASRIEFKPASHFWGGAPQTGTYTPSRLPMEVQQSIVQDLGEMYPDIYKALWEPGIKVSEFVGKLHAYQPDVYEDLRLMTYSRLSPRPQHYPAQYHPGYGRPQTW